MNPKGKKMIIFKNLVRMVRIKFVLRCMEKFFQCPFINILWAKFQMNIVLVSFYFFFYVKNIFFNLLATDRRLLFFINANLKIWC